ncbi:choice-of-anchor D domain-containing protein [Pontibacter harenae]|uniref:choice-of-anchor D domain-containing protein n=1 Tax=Pontibacter harenae TaxID=2894083 RepID=UPI003F701FF1
MSKRTSGSVYVDLVSLAEAAEAPAGPEINVSVGSSSITNGYTQNFGTITVGASSAPVVFSVRNDGTSTLNLGATLGGINPDDFSIDLTGVDLTLEPGESTTASVIFSPTRFGNKSAEVQILSDDLDESPFVIYLSGSAVVSQPNITSLSTYSGLVGSEVIITGTGFTSVDRVEFATGVDALDFSVVSDTEIRVIVPAGAVDGPITVYAGTYSSSSSIFQVLVPPSNLSVSPSEGYVGDEVVISGENLEDTERVTFNGLDADFGAVTDENGNTVIYAVVPEGAETGPLEVRTPGGTARDRGGIRRRGCGCP